MSSKERQKVEKLRNDSKMENTKLTKVQHGPSRNKDLSMPKSSDTILYVARPAIWGKCSKSENRKKLRRRSVRRKKPYTMDSIQHMNKGEEGNIHKTKEKADKLKKYIE